MLSSERLLLRQVEYEDLNENYLRWVNDAEVVRYTDIRFQRQSKDTIYKYWKEYKDSKNDHWFAICVASQNKHIGNIKLGPVNYLHQTGELSLIIGEKCFWGKGYATESIKLISSWAFSSLKLYKLSSTIYRENVASKKVFEKAGFRCEGILKEQAQLNHTKRTDLYKMGLVKKQWENQNQW